MFTAKVTRKDFVPQGLRVFVEFSDGTQILEESCIPQNEEGLRFWMKSRLETLNSAAVIESKYVDGDVVDVSDPVVVQPAPTAEEVARVAWLKNYRKWVEVKTKLIDTGILTGSEPKTVQLKTKVTNDFLPAYLDFI